MENAPGTVAVVDDDQSMLRSVQRLLKLHGFPTEGYLSAERFLSLAQLQNIRCIVLDIHLGGMSGVELWQQLKQVGTSPPVIFMTALEDDALEKAALSAGCVAYLRKPFPAESLIFALNTALGLSSCD